MIIRKSEREIEKIAAAGRVAADTIAHVGEHIQPGVTTAELDRIGEEFIRSHGAVPTSKGYRGFPAALCISPNTMIVHGIPGPYRVQEGDLLTIDVGVTLDGYVADTAYTFGVGEISPEAERLLEVGQTALAAGIEQAQAGNRIGDVSAAIQRVVEDAGFAVVRALVGHGVGRSYHEDPQIPNYGSPGRGVKLTPGMTLAIEPMITAGGVDIRIDDDQWSVYTADDSLSAHFEHTVAVTESGPKILTPVAASLVI
jgi:methionyl aminopeptidase